MIVKELNKRNDQRIQRCCLDLLIDIGIPVKKIEIKREMGRVTLEFEERVGKVNLFSLDEKQCLGKRPQDIAELLIKSNKKTTQ